MTLTRSTFVQAATAAGAASFLPAPVDAAPALRGEPEQKTLKIGIAVPDVAYWSLYAAAAQGLWKNEGLDVQLVTFGGDAPVAQALAGGSVDINAASIVGLFNMIGSGQKVKTFASVCNQAVFSFVGGPKVKSWKDIKGGTYGVASYGSMTAAVGTIALEEHGLKVGKDVQLVQTGGTPNAYAAVESGRLTASGFSLPYALQAQSAGMNFLGSMVTITGPQWPSEIFYAKDEFLATKPKTVTAMLRGIANAVKLIETQPGPSISILASAMKLKPEVAAGCYNVVKNSFLADGAFPKNMSKVWKVLIASGTVKAPVPMNQWYDGTWVDNYKSWKP